jgi:hypothetical protein
MINEICIDLEEQKQLNISPETKKRELELAEKKYETQWKSCCGNTFDSRATIFFSQFTIAMVVTSFCIYQLIHEESCEAQGLYSSILTLILGVFLPSPKMKK